MSKGFGFTSEVQLFVKVTQARDSKQLHKLMEQLADRYSDLQISDFIQKALDPLPNEDSIWFYQNLLGPEKYRERQALIAEGITKLIIEHGYIAGQDFCHNPDGGIILSHEASERILAEIPEMDRKSFDAAFITIGQVR